MDKSFYDYKLCYVEENSVWFTTCPLDKQWGDDWNDAPYEHNAGVPYEWRDYRETPEYYLKIVCIYRSGLETPADIAHGNSQYSVEDINKGCAAWLVDRYGKSKLSIMAGTSLPDFIDALERNYKGSVFIPISEIESYRSE